MSTPAAGAWAGSASTCRRRRGRGRGRCLPISSISTRSARRCATSSGASRRRRHRRGERMMLSEYEPVIQRLEGLASDRGLVFDPVIFQITDSDEIAEVASMGLPNRFIHWYWGGAYKELVTQQNKEVFTILELVLTRRRRTRSCGARTPISR